MEYIVASDRFVLKEKGQAITEKELLEAGCDISALVSAGHLKNKQADKVAAIKEEGDE
jgi:hypothetical protein